MLSRMSQLCKLPNITWKINNLSETNEEYTFIDFLGMKWMLAVVLHSPDQPYDDEVIRLTFERLSPLTNSQLTNVTFAVDTSITVKSSPIMITSAYPTMSCRKWHLHNASVENIKHYYLYFSYSLPITYQITFNLSKASTEWQIPRYLMDDQRIQIPLCMNSLSQDFKKLFTHPVQCDVLLKCADKLFYAHKIILSARSDVLRTMFRSDLKEKKDVILHVTDMEPRILQHLLFYLYSGKLSDLSFDCACKLHAAAEKFGVGALKVKCALLIAEKYAEERKESDSDVVDDEVGNLDIVKTLLKVFFKSKRWRQLATECPKLACEMCSPFFDPVSEKQSATEKYGVDLREIKCTPFVVKKYLKEMKENNSKSANKAQDEEKDLVVKKELLKLLFESVEWKTLALECPKLASEMCNPLIKYATKKCRLAKDNL